MGQFGVSATRSRSGEGFYGAKITNPLVSSTDCKIFPRREHCAAIKATHSLDKLHSQIGSYL